MTSEAARKFREENQFLFPSDNESESENEGIESDQSDNEDSDHEIEASVENLKFEICNEEHTSVGRPSRFLGAHRQLPRAETIPEEKFATPRTLFEHIYGTLLYEEIQVGTAEKGKKIEPENSFIPTTSDIIQFLGDLLLIWALKPASMELCEFWVLMRTHPETFGFQDFFIFDREKFNFLNKYLDIGRTVKVKNATGHDVIDLNKKLNPLIDFFNQ